MAGITFSCGVLSGNGNGSVEDITSLRNFDHTIKNKKKFVLVDFMSPRNTPCNMIAPNLAVIASEMADSLVVGTVDVESDYVSEERLKQRCKVEEIPCLILYNEGREIARNVGYMTKDELRVWIRKYFAEK